MKLYRIHLNPKPKNDDDNSKRARLIDYCLGSNDSYGKLAIGWSEYHAKSLEEMEAKLLKETNKEKLSSNNAIKIFQRLELNDLLWARDLDGIYYICRVISQPMIHCDTELDIGAIVSVEKHKAGLSVPGLVVSRFSNSTGISPTIQAINDKSIIEYSKFLFNELSNNYKYSVSKIKYDLYTMLGPFDLEELIIDYLQVEKDYYLSKNSVARNSTTIKIECELYSRTGQGKPIVLQVKHKVDPKSEVNRGSYYSKYVKDGKLVYLFFADDTDYIDRIDGVEAISKVDIERFLKEKKDLLPFSLQKWIDMCQ